MQWTETVFLLLFFLLWEVFLRLPRPPALPSSCKGILIKDVTSRNNRYVTGNIKPHQRHFFNWSRSSVAFVNQDWQASKKQRYCIAECVKPGKFAYGKKVAKRRYFFPATTVTKEFIFSLGKLLSCHHLVWSSFSFGNLFIVWLVGLLTKNLKCSQLTSKLRRWQFSMAYKILMLGFWANNK